ncbi:MAG: hypothetical protein JOZ19_13055 [Rubrobacter sp.]|nr:hypothetical protein [Rubrobacter sp.]
MSEQAGLPVVVEGANGYPRPLGQLVHFPAVSSTGFATFCWGRVYTTEYYNLTLR